MNNARTWESISERDSGGMINSDSDSDEWQYQMRQQMRAAVPAEATVIDEASVPDEGSR